MRSTEPPSPDERRRPALLDTESAKAAGATPLLGALDAPAGRLAVLVDPVGAAFSVREAHGRAGAQLINEPGTWAMSSLHTTHRDRLTLR